MDWWKSKNQLICMGCNLKFKCMNNLNKHLWTHGIKIKSQRCNFFQKFKKNSKDISIFDSNCKNCYRCKKNFMKRFKNKEIKCENCDELFKCNVSFQLHLFDHEGDEIFQCKNCGELFALKTDLQRHLLNHDKRQSLTVIILCKKWKSYS